VYLEITLLAYLIDKIFGEFSFIRHPVIIMGDYIKWFEKRFYKDDIFRGSILTITLIVIVWIVIDLISSNLHTILPWYIELILISTLASTTIASNMLYASVKDLIKNPDNIKYLVSRDTKELKSSDINKAGIETYAENLSDGVIAPLFYLLLFGLEGAFIYKAINTLDSMVGYRNMHYEKFGKFSAIIDDVVNYIPARITAILISLLMFNPKALFNFYRYGKKHDSPNAGHPISAMALAIGVKLGGDTIYFGKLKKKAHFGEGRDNIGKEDILKALSFQWRLDILLLLIIGATLWKNMVGI
jgi:adenosylcobinamide-phosphate synthase